MIVARLETIMAYKERFAGTTHDAAEDECWHEADVQMQACGRQSASPQPWKWAGCHYTCPGPSVSHADQAKDTAGLWSFTSGHRRRIASLDTHSLEPPEPPSSSHSPPLICSVRLSPPAFVKPFALDTARRASVLRPQSHGPGTRTRLSPRPV
ncbi:hypothetical protein K491DRAFT_394243 [Lophiostoma macrostomum CBS 122681]|uniref:Uncharacterized protein n=1 Tax=Lophiostoma macrostomum CBS 122681 TaxID=1314788 RepID=A0A6A6T8J8_9PLEO|nr:hypothetical protein K491DRAFT_394243 [Lophiostoma macrostomum CBS 122681]